MSLLLRSALILVLLAISPATLAVTAIDMKRPSGTDWKSQLRSGHILTTESSDPLHLPTMLGSDRFSPFIHLGVVEVTPDGIYVYDTTATIGKYFIGNRSPSDTMQGKVRRLRLQEFMDYAKVFNIFAPPRSVNTEKLTSFLRQHWIDQTPFDPYFNLNDSSALYCSELIAMGLEHAGSRRYAPAAMRYNPSLEVIRRWMKISAPRFLFPYQLTEPGNWLGTVSTDYSKQAILIDRLIKYEVYQRFTSNQKIGNIMYRNGAELTVRQPLQQFAALAHNLALDSRYNDASVDKLYKTVRELANQTLGPDNNVPRRALPRCQLDPRACARN